MTRLIAAFVALVVLALQPAHAERWLRALVGEKPHSQGAYNWFDVDSVGVEKKGGLVLAHTATASVKAIRAGSIATWTLWGFDCRGKKAYTIGSAAAGKFTQTANWKTDPKTVVALDAPKPEPVVSALATRLCGWRDIWPPGVIQ